jgi:DNA-binding transcriptional ArsR family regulator
VTEQRREVASAAELKVLASPVRLRILRLTLDRPRTNAELAAELGLTAATTHYHVKALLGAGFLAADPAGRPGRAIPYRATGRSWQIEPEDDDVPAVADAMLSAFLQEWRAGGRRSARFGVRTVLRLDQDQLAEFDGRLHALIEEFVAAPRRDGAIPYSLLTLLHEQA